ncbi:MULTISPECIES: CPBP family intramembrane glutamic endopeptidase [unclassified Gordonia (in: high G+C Gram-positive bacteria)]|uniref:CPBP family intramembrane glutamic endopeptidase n=1 Tax=unclassified Gordonia (in: high G+C Gram-positive bacteria) TaxID=2657482 RepID=UPI001F0FFBC8|nr:type II CAAX endopeptidase family protein [Gordonia sp. ABSL49_1]MCH5644999.1 CPBP family intramembrane metalloprotease [Gordonia sp. ABSL49_1]
MTSSRTLLNRLGSPAPGTVVDGPDALRRRRLVVAVFLVVGAIVLGFSLTSEPGDASFYPLTAVLAATWIVGGFSSGPIRLGRFAFSDPRSVGAAAVLGTAAGLLVGSAFLVGALITREIPALADLVSQVLALRDEGSIIVITVITLGNGLAEEIFFRGAVYSAAEQHHPVVVSTVLYVIATLASGNPMLGFAAIILGAVCAVLRRCTDGVLAPICCHVVWGAIVLFGLPPLF